MQYIRLSEGLNSYKLIPANDDIWNHIKTNDKDYYTSLYTYTDEHFKQWKETGTVSGIQNATTNKLFFDFDNAKEPDKARSDAITLVTRLIAKGFKQDNIQLAFSGNKGFSVEVDTTMKLNRDEFRNITFGLAGDLASFDRVVNDNQRIIRVVGTKHNKSGLYKIPITVTQLTGLPVSEIKALASSLDNADQDIMDSWTEVEMPKELVTLSKTPYKEPKQETSSLDLPVLESELDLSKKPKWLTEAKYALQMGYFGGEGDSERNTAFMILGATYKSQGFPKEIAYRMLKGVAEIQAQRNNREQFSSKEIWNNIIEVVYSPNWRGATYSYQNTPLLQEVTKRLGLKVETNAPDGFIPLSNIAGIFKKFATEIDKNTIKLGIPQLDKNVRVTTSMLVGLLAAPSAGKTSVAINILNEASRNNIKAGFFSLDMGAPLVFQRLLQKHTGLSGEKVLNMYKNGDKNVLELEKKTMEQYDNVGFCFKTGVTTEHIKEFIAEENAKNPEQPMKLLVVDYLECLVGPYSDPTSNTAIISNQLKDIANEFEMCIVLLLQPQKQAGDPSSELLSMRNIKGASVIEQACSVILTMWRPGFSPMKPEEDKYATIAVVKNRMGTIGNYSFGWDGLTGKLLELDELEMEDLDALRKRKAAEKAEQEI